MFRQDALEGSRLLGLTLTHRNGVPMCGVPYHAAKVYTRKLVDAGMKVAICEQLGIPGKGKGIVERRVIEVISPGTVVDDSFLDGRTNNYLVSVSLAKENVGGIASIDLSTGELFTRLFDLVELDDVISQEFARRSPKEILVQESFLEQSEVLSGFLARYPEVLINRNADWLYDPGYAHSELCRLLGTDSLKGFGFEAADPALHPVSALLQYAQNAALHSLKNLKGVVKADGAHVVGLDEACIRNLELVRNMRDGGVSHSLLWAIDETRTGMGARLLRHWILEPCRDLTEIVARHALVDQLYHAQDALSKLRLQLGTVHDVERLVSRIVLDKAGPKDVVALATSLDIILKISDVMATCSPEMTWPHQVLEGCCSAVELVRTNLADDVPYLIADGGAIRDGCDLSLDKQRALAKDGQSFLDAYLNDERQRSGLAGLRLRENKIIGYYLELNKSQSKDVPPHFIRKHSTLHGERYTTARLMELESEIQSAKSLSLEMELTIFQSLCEKLKTICPDLVRAAEVCARIDVLVSFAWTATTRGFTKPLMVDAPVLDIVGGRHPVVEHSMNGGIFVPNDLHLGASSADAPQIVLLTGPNMAGKSTYLRQAALVVIMAHAGSFIPADKATIGMVDRVFCRVGASDNLAGGESTFLVEMHETARILRTASSSSLVIMDEVGRGTSTQDGLSMARAILEYINVNIRCRTLFATHYHELTELVLPKVANFSMAVQEEGDHIMFPRTVLAGPSGKSYGIDVARLAGVPEQVILRAREVLSSLPALAASVGSTDLSIKHKSASKEAQVQNTKRAEAPLRPVEPELFSVQEGLEQFIVNFDIDASTPLEAMNAIQRWKEYLGVKPLKKRS